MKGVLLQRPLTKHEFWGGLAYLILHVFLLPFALGLVAGLLTMNGHRVTNIALNAVYAFIGFAAVFLIFRKFLKAQFEHFVHWLPVNLIIVIRNFLIYYVLYMLLSFIIVNLPGVSLTNPNNDAIVSMTRDYFYPSIAITVLLVPFVEECLFRGVLFLGIGAKFRILGYVASTLLFAFSHVFQSMLANFRPELFLTMLLYIPAGLVLGRTCEKSGTIWCSILLHMVINLTSLLSYYLTSP